MSSRIVTRSKAPASIDEPVARQPVKQTTRVSKAVQAKKAKADGRRKGAAEKTKADDRRKAAAEQRATRARSLPDSREDPSVSDDEPDEMDAQQGQPQPSTPEPPEASAPESPKAQPQAPKPALKQPASGQPSTPDEPLLKNGRFDEDLFDTPRTWVPITPIPGAVRQGRCKSKLDPLLRTVPMFDPARKSAQRWLETFERVAQANGLDGNTIVDVFLQKVADAADWVDSQQASTYEELRTDFLTFFGSEVWNRKTLSAARERTQQLGEAPSSYFYALAALGAKVTPALSETQLRDLFVRGLLPSLQPYVEIWFGELFGWGRGTLLEKFDSKAIKLGLLKARASEEARPSSTTQLDSTISATRSGHSLAVTHGKQSNRFQPYPSAGSDKTGNQKGVCFKCHQPGHIRQNCPNVGQQATSGSSDNKQAVCFNCGQPGHRYRGCPHNKSKPVESGQVTPQDLQQIVDHIKHWVENRDSDKRSSD